MTRTPGTKKHVLDSSSPAHRKKCINEKVKPCFLVSSSYSAGKKTGSSTSQIGLERRDRLIDLRTICWMTMFPRRLLSLNRTGPVTPSKEVLSRAWMKACSHVLSLKKEITKLAFTNDKHNILKLTWVTMEKCKRIYCRDTSFYSAPFLLLPLPY